MVTACVKRWLCGTMWACFLTGVFPAILLTSHGAIQFVTYEWLKQVG